MSIEVTRGRHVDFWYKCTGVEWSKTNDSKIPPTPVDVFALLFTTKSLEKDPKAYSNAMNSVEKQEVDELRSSTRPDLKAFTKQTCLPFPSAFAKVKVTFKITSGEQRLPATLICDATCGQKQKARILNAKTDTGH